MSSLVEGDQLRLYLPKNMPEGIIRGNGELPARIAYIGHILTSRPYDSNRDYITLNKTLLREQVSAKATDKAFAAYGKLIEIDRKFTPSVRSKGYRWNEILCGFGATHHTYYCPRFKQHLRDIRNKRRSEYDPIRSQLDHDLKGLSLEISNLPLFLNNLPPKLGVKCELHRRTVIQKSAEDIINGNRGLITKSNKTGRIHCLANRLCTHLREHLTLWGSKVVEIDLASSQPYFLATLFNSRPLREAVSQGEFYHRINEQLDEPIDFDDKDAYASMKQSVLAIIYATPHKGFDYTRDNSWRHYPIVEAIEAAYGGINDYLANYRQTHGQKALSIAMQRMESDVFINVVLAKLQALGIPAIPIHDAVMCRIEDMHMVEQIIYDSLLSSTQIKPTLRTSKNPTEIQTHV